MFIIIFFHLTEIVNRNDRLCDKSIVLLGGQYHNQYIMIKKNGIISYDQRPVSNQKTREKFGRNNLYFVGAGLPS